MDELAALKVAEREANEIIQKARDGAFLMPLYAVCVCACVRARRHCNVVGRAAPRTLTSARPCPLAAAERKLKLREATRVAKQEVEEWQRVQTADLESKAQVGLAAVFARHAVARLRACG